MRAVICAFACALFWTASAGAQEFKAILSSEDFRPGSEIKLTIQGGTPPFSFGFGSGFFRGERLLLKVERDDERNYRFRVLEELDAATAKWRTITVEDESGRETRARGLPAQTPSQPKANGLEKLIADLQSIDEAVRLQAAKKLGMMGAAARPALPALKRLAQDPDEDVRHVVAAAIRRIEATPGNGWVKITLPEQRFEIQFPAQPESYEKRRMEEVWKVEVQEYAWELIRRDPEQVLGFMVFNVLPPNRTSAQPAQFWFDGVQRHINPPEATTPLSSRDFKLADRYSARDVEYKAKDERRFRARMVHTSIGVYVIFAVGSLDFVSGDVVKRFLESFKTSDEPAREPATGAGQVQALIQRLQSTESFDRLFALRALAKLGAQAKEAIPHVEKLASEGNEEERPYARTVLEELRRAAGSGGNGVGEAPFRPVKLWSHSFALKCRRPDEAAFTKTTKEYGVEVFREPKTGATIYLAETGSMTAVPHPAGVTAPIAQPKLPAWLTGLTLKARPAGQNDFAGAKTFGMEIFRDPNLNNWLCITEQGMIAAARIERAPTQKGNPQWVHGIELRVRKAADADWNDAASFGIEVFRDPNSENLVYVSEQDQPVLVPDTQALAANGKAARWLRRIVLACRHSKEPTMTESTRRFGVEVYHDVSTGTIIYVTETGSFAVVAAPANANGGLPSAPALAESLVLKCRRADETDFTEQSRAFGVDVYRDEVAGVLLLINELGNIAAFRTKD